MPKPLLTAFFIALIVGTVSFAFAEWTPPTATPPNDNTPAPLNVGILPQNKDGVLTLGGLGVLGSALITSGGGYTLPSTLQLGVNGKVGATAYCDQNGNNCVSTLGGTVTSVSSGSGSTSIIGGGIVTGVEKNIGSNWSMISFTGSYNSQDAASMGGYIYRLGSTVKATFVEATGISKDVVLNETNQCAYTFCIRMVNGSIIMKPGSNTVAYILWKF